MIELLSSSSSSFLRDFYFFFLKAIEAGLRGDAAATDRLMADDYFFMTRDGVVHENLKAALLVRMKSGESEVGLLARMKSGLRHHNRWQ